jgi:hypothetical protein
MRARLLFENGAFKVAPANASDGAEMTDAVFCALNKLSLSFWHRYKLLLRLAKDLLLSEITQAVLPIQAPMILCNKTGGTNLLPTHFHHESRPLI